MTTTTVAELASISDAVERSRQRISALADPYVGTDRDDVVTAIYEIERTLLAVQRALQRATRTVQGRRAGS